MRYLFGDRDRELVAICSFGSEASGSSVMVPHIATYSPVVLDILEDNAHNV
jgi:hypothetical protein